MQSDRDRNILEIESRGKKNLTKIEGHYRQYRQKSIIYLSQVKKDLKKQQKKM